MRRAIKGSLPSPAITEPLLRRNYLGNETNLKLTACGKPDVHCMETLWRTHNQRHTLFRLQVLAVSFPSIHTAAPTCACEDAWESNWSFWQLLACLFDFTVPPLIHFHFIAPSYSAVCVSVCMCVQSVAPFHALKCSLTLWLLCGAGELWAVINLKCYLRDTHTLWQRQDLSAVVPLCNRRWGGKQLRKQT